MTKREFYTEVMNGNITDEIKDFAAEEIAKLDEKNASRKPSKKQIENIEISNKIFEYISGTEDGAFISDIATALEISKQKVAALCVLMKKDGKLTDAEVAVKGKGKLKKYTITAE